MEDWIWIAECVALLVHNEQLAEHGGGEGLRDAGALESAMMRPRNLIEYGSPDAAALTAAYAFGIARNHPFVDGNKRAAAVISESFLITNGYILMASDEELVASIQSLASGELTEEQLAAWLRERIIEAGEDGADM